MMSRQCHFAGGLSIKKAESYYFTGNTFPVRQSIHIKSSNFCEDAVNFIEPSSITPLLQGVPTHRVIAILYFALTAD